MTSFWSASRSEDNPRIWHGEPSEGQSHLSLYKAFWISGSCRFSFVIATVSVVTECSTLFPVKAFAMASLSFVGHWDDLANYVLSAGVPVVEISSVRKDLGIPCVMEDNEAIGRLGAEHLLRRNFKNFVWAPFCDDAVNEERFSGFTASVRAGGFDCVRLLPVNTRRSARLSRHVNFGRNFSAPS
jgi:hypothetical protein